LNTDCRLVTSSSSYLRCRRKNSKTFLHNYFRQVGFVSHYTSSYRVRHQTSNVSRQHRAHSTARSFAADRSHMLHSSVISRHLDKMIHGLDHLATFACCPSMVDQLEHVVVASANASSKTVQGFPH